MGKMERRLGHFCRLFLAPTPTPPRSGVAWDNPCTLALFLQLQRMVAYSTTRLLCRLNVVTLDTWHLVPICNTYCSIHIGCTQHPQDLLQSLAFIPGKTGVVVPPTPPPLSLKNPHDDPGINRVESADGGETKWRREKPEPDPQNGGLHARCIFTLEPITEQDL